MTTMNHADYQKRTRRMTVEQLAFVIKDCRETLAANPDGEKAGYYADEINYCAMELKRRNSAA